MDREKRGKKDAQKQVGHDPKRTCKKRKKSKSSFLDLVGRRSLHTLLGTRKRGVCEGGPLTERISCCRSLGTPGISRLGCCQRIERR